jgi:hypothetical protein
MVMIWVPTRAFFHMAASGNRRAGMPLVVGQMLIQRFGMFKVIARWVLRLNYDASLALFVAGTS